MARLTVDQWQEARRTWEADPTATFEAVADQYKVSRQAISKRANAEGWAKVGALRQVVERAQFKADRKVAQVAAQPSEVADATAKRDEQATIEESVEIRADVIDRHRADWAEHRKFFKLEDLGKDFEAGKKAKISAEMLMIRQKGERAAYGLEDNSAPPPTSAADVIRELAELLPD